MRQGCRLDSLDREFSVFIRSRDNWTCQRCGRDFWNSRDYLHTSHFVGRANKATRFDPDNCDALCWECHEEFHAHPEAHKAWKLFRLGPERFEALQVRKRQVVKVDAEAIRAMMHLAKRRSCEDAA